MTGGISEGIWDFAQELTVCDPHGEADRVFRGFIEPLSMKACSEKGRLPGLKPRERMRLIAHPGEDFFGGEARRVLWDGRCFELMAVKQVYIGGTLCHRECVLLELREAFDGD